LHREWLERNKGFGHRRYKGGKNNPGSAAWMQIIVGRSRLWGKKRGYKGITTSVTELVKLWEQHDHCCDGCGVPQSELKRALCVDHNHETGEFRSFLCGQCNHGMGLLKDNPALLRKLADILEK